MALPEAIEKLGRAIFESPFSEHSGSAPELAEIRLAVIDAVKARSHRVGNTQVFSHNRIRIQLRGVPAEQTAALENSFLAEFLAGEIRGALARSSVRFAADLQVDVRASTDLPGPGEEFVTVETDMRPAVAEAAAAPGVAWLTVARGEANCPEIEITKARTNIGRTVDVYRTEGPSRRNDLAFAGEGEVERTVSREHAHIEWARESGSYRLFNDRWYRAGATAASECGLWLVRDGGSLPVHRGRGVALHAGDEIHLGQAVVKFTVRPSD